MVQLTSVLETKYLSKDMTLCDIEGIKVDSGNAVLVDFGDCEHWVPKSACEYGLSEDGEDSLIAIKDWKYEELGL